MDNYLNDSFQNTIAPAPARPQFLKILCVLSFIMSGLMILIYLVGTFCLAIPEETAQEVLDKMRESGQNISISDDSTGILKQIGIICLICLLANIVSLTGVIMMWKLNRIGFFLYAAAELATNFVGMNLNAAADGSRSYGGMIFNIAIDLVFIVLFAVNLKHMNKNQTQAV